MKYSGKTLIYEYFLLKSSGFKLLIKVKRKVIIKIKEIINKWIDKNVVKL